jgi:hypothetical protein
MAARSIAAKNIGALAHNASRLSLARRALAENRGEMKRETEGEKSEGVKAAKSAVRGGINAAARRGRRRVMARRQAARAARSRASARRGALARV